LKQCLQLQTRCEQQVDQTEKSNNRRVLKHITQYELMHGWLLQHGSDMGPA
jgi:hypothetical protein